MKLTTQMRVEIDTTHARISQLAQEFWTTIRRATESLGRISFETRGNMTAIIEELKTHKVRIENILCETDVKEQGHSSYTRTSSGFLERFYELALRKNNCLLSNCFSILVKPLMTVKQ